MTTDFGKRAQREIIRVCHSGLEFVTLRAEVIRLLRKAVHVDVVFFSTMDPSTMLFTGVVSDEPLASHAQSFLKNEFLQDDVNKFISLARSSDHIAWLGRVTEGRLQDSQRFREILDPINLGDEMRVALVSHKACWGALCLHRERGNPNFTADDAALLAEVAPHIAEGLRNALLMTSSTETALPGEPGLVLLNDELSLEAATPAARGWLAELNRRPGNFSRDLPEVVYTVAARLLALERGDDELGLPRAHLRGQSGGWIVVHGSRLTSFGGRGQIAILLEQAQPPEIAGQIVKAYGLSERESMVAQLVLQGCPTTEISERLFISGNTVQDHLKKIFEKVGVSSRRELMASVFASQYLPRIATGAEPGAQGWFSSSKD